MKFSQIPLIILLASISFAISSQQESVSLSVTEVSNLVKVDGALDFSQFLPSYNYSKNITVRWNVPQAALRNINAEKVPLYVRITPKSADSWIYFEGGKRSLDFILSCVVKDDSCAQNSVLSSNVPVHISSPKNAVYPHDDGIIANASLSPFEAESAGKTQPSSISTESANPPPEGASQPANENNDGSTPTGFAVFANNPALKNILLALFAIGAIFLIVYFREYLFELVVSPRERKRL